MKIAVAGMGYVGLSLAVLLAQKNEVSAVDIVKEKVELVNTYAKQFGKEEMAALMEQHQQAYSQHKL